MAPKKTENNESASGEKGLFTLTPGEQKLIDAVLKESPSTVKASLCNWAIVAGKLEMKNAKVAQERFRQVCKKFQWFEGTATDAGTDTDPITPTSSPKKRTASQALDQQLLTPGSGEEADVKSTPAKRVKRAPKAKKAAPVKTEATEAKTEMKSPVSNPRSDDGADRLDDALKEEPLLPEGEV
ncbi:hypothetical protein M426DRAFT_97070 [Hypoxylon sp. CI-4A]|nr:hypothetical protein M426DRAFT_97070 [Hypoxylon sp. CI-4A]